MNSNVQAIKKGLLLFMALSICLESPPVRAECEDMPNVVPNQAREIICQDIFVRPITTSGGYVPGVTSTLWRPPGSVTSVSAGSHHGTGEYYANAPCPYDQASVPPAVISRSESVRVQSRELAGRLDELKAALKAITEGTDYIKCQNIVNEIIALVCGTKDGKYNETLGEEGVDFYEIHMMSDGVISLYNKAPQYLRTYNLVHQSLEEGNYENPSHSVKKIATKASPISHENSSRLPAVLDITDEDGPANEPSETPSLSCEDFACENGYIDHKICFQPQLKEVSRRKKELCKKCLNPRYRPPKGIYPSDFKRAYHLQQEIAALEKQVAFSEGKAACVERHVDVPLSEGRQPSSSTYRRCILTVDPQATSAEYCLYCDSSGQTVGRKKPGFKEILPALLTTGVWLGLGAYAHNQSKKISRGNWEAGYPTDDRHSWKTANYLLGGFPMVVNAWQSTGAFGCPPTGGLNGEGTLSTNAAWNFPMNNQLSGSPNVQVNGANGYPPHLTLPWNPAAYSGSFNQSTHAGAWDPSLNNTNNPAVLQEQIRRQRAELEHAVRQNQQRMAAIGQLQNLQVQMQSLAQQSATINSQLGHLNSQYKNVYTSVAGSSGYQNSNGLSSGIPGINLNAGVGGEAFTNIRAGWDLSGWGGVNSYSGANGYPPVPGSRYNSRGPFRPGRGGNDHIGLGLPPIR